MCSGDTFASRIEKVFFGLEDPKMGCLGGATSLHLLEKSNHKPLVIGGIMREASVQILQDFFKLHRRSE